MRQNSNKLSGGEVVAGVLNRTEGMESRCLSGRLQRKATMEPSILNSMQLNGNVSAATELYGHAKPIQHTDWQAGLFIGEV